MATCACCGDSVEWWVRLPSHQQLPICHNCLDGLLAQRDGQAALRSGTWVATGFEPIFWVTDVSRSVGFYEQLGFETSHHDESYAFAHRDRDLTVHLAHADGTWPAGHGALYVHCQDADQVAAEWRQAGVMVDGPQDRDYGKREGSTVDPDGNQIRFGSPLREASPEHAHLPAGEPS